MKSPRKYIRIALSQDDEAALAKVKAKAENDTGIAMSDSMFVLSVLRKAMQPAPLHDKLREEKARGHRT